MQVDFYMFLNSEDEFSAPESYVINWDDANDKHNPFSVYNFKRSFEAKTDDIVQSEIEQLLLKNTIMFGNEPIYYNSLDKHATQDNAEFLKTCMKKIERHIARNCLTDDLVEKYMAEDVEKAIKCEYISKDNIAHRYKNAFLEFSERYDNYMFSSRFQCYFADVADAQYLQDMLSERMQVKLARSNPLVPMSSKIMKIEA